MALLQFARVKAMEMEHSVPLTDALQDNEPAAKKPKEDVPDVRSLVFITL